jgi:anthranilate phosphoribosyltransferase
MMKGTLADLTREEFEALTDAFADPEYGELSPAEFGAVLAALDAADSDVIELTGEVHYGTLVLDTSAPLPVKGNEIRLGDKRIRITLRSVHLNEVPVG